jgi:hypothetical protein
MGLARNVVSNGIRIFLTPNVSIGVPSAAHHPWGNQTPRGSLLYAVVGLYFGFASFLILQVT